MGNNSHHLAVPAVYVLLLRNNDQEILLLQRQNTGYKDGMHSFVAGHVEAGEVPIQALIREAHEEAGITIDPANAAFAHLMYRFSHDSTRSDMFFAVRQWQGEITNMEPHKCAELKWFPIDDLPNMTIPYIAQAIKYFRSSTPYSEFDEREKTG